MCVASDLACASREGYNRHTPLSHVECVDHRSGCVNALCMRGDTIVSANTSRSHESIFSLLSDRQSGGNEACSNDAIRPSPRQRVAPQVVLETPFSTCPFALPAVRAYPGFPHLRFA